MLLLKQRAWLLALLAVALLASYAPGSANANQGPFLYHRASAAEGNGVKLAAKEPEGIASSTGEQFFAFKLLGTEVEITARQAQLKGVIYNNALQGQVKLLIAFFQPTLTKPAGTNCVVKIGQNDTIKVFGHLAWTWDGTEAQLKEQPVVNQKPDWIFTGQELQQGATGLPKGVPMYTITLSGAGCLLASTVAVEGSYAAAIEPGNVGEFSTSETQKLLISGTRQHFWNGKANIGVTTELRLGGENFTHVGEYKFKTTGRQGGAPQEIARFES